MELFNEEEFETTEIEMFCVGVVKHPPKMKKLKYDEKTALLATVVLDFNLYKDKWTSLVFEVWGKAATYFMKNVEVGDIIECKATPKNYGQIRFRIDNFNVRKNDKTSTD